MAALPENDRISGPYLATAGQTDFPADFPLLQLAALRVQIERASVLTTKAAPLLTVHSATADGFTVRLDTPSQAGDRVVVYSYLPAARLRSHTPNGAVKSSTLEDDAGSFQAQLQELRRDIDRAILLPLGEIGSNLPPANARLNGIGLLGSDFDGQVKLIDARLIKGDPGGTTDLIGTRHAAQLMNIGPEYDAVRTTGYLTAGDGGGAFYRRAALEPVHSGKFLSADGQWWELADPNVRPEMFGGAVGMNSTTAFSALEGVVSNSIVDLRGGTYLVDALPTGNTYINGSFQTTSAPTRPEDRGVTYPASDSPSVLSSSGSTGGYGGAYTGGVNNTPTVPGRSNKTMRVLIGSQGCRADFARSGCFVSIYSWAYGNVSGNFASRQSVAGCPQAVNLGAEEGQIYGFGGLNANVHFSRTNGTKSTNIGTRLSEAGGARYNGNIFSNTSRAGGGWGAVIEPVFTGGSVTSVNIVSGGQGYSTDQVLRLMARQSNAESDASFTFTVNANGTITAVSILNGGTGYVDGNTYDAVINYPTEGMGECAGNYSTFLSRAGGKAAANIAATGATNWGDYSAIIASSGGTTDLGVGSYQSVMSSTGSGTHASLSSVITGNNAHADHEGVAVFGRRVRSGVVRSLVGGDNTAGSATTANRKWQIVHGNGNMQLAGALTQSTPFADYAEYFENLTPGTIPLGTIVSLVGRKVKPWAEGERLHGVVSATAGIKLGDSPFSWQGRYLYGEFGEPLMETIDVVSWPTVAAYEGPIEPNQVVPSWAETWETTNSFANEYEDGTVDTEVTSSWFARWTARAGYDGSVDQAPTPHPNDAIYATEQIQVENPEFDHGVSNVPRSERPDEWSCIGLIGQVHVRVGRNYAPGEQITAGLRVMEMKTPFDAVKGYGVAFCFLVSGTD